MSSALQSNAIVSNLFPTVVRDRILGPQGDTKESAMETPKRRLQSYLRDDTPGKKGEGNANAPIAEFFSDTTVLFADVSLLF